MRYSLPSLPVSDSDSDERSPRSTPISAAERLAMIEQRTREMTSALSSRAADDLEADLSHRLDLIDIERDTLEEKRKQDEMKYMRKSGEGLTVEEAQFTYRNEHFQDLSSRDAKDKVSGTFIFDGKSSKDVNDSGSKRENKLEHDMFAVDPSTVDTQLRHAEAESKCKLTFILITCFKFKLCVSEFYVLDMHLTLNLCLFFIMLNYNQCFILP